jgi:hypothetical protein
MNFFKIAGGDDACYGPSFGPSTVEEIGLIGTEEDGYLLLRVKERLCESEQDTQLLAVRPRYVGDTLGKLRTSSTTVGVWLVLPGHEENVCHGLNETNSKYWSIGTCTPQ